MHVVALNWRDLKNPLGGGAEVHLEEILRYLGHRGHRCTLLTSKFPGAPDEEEADGYRIVRGGNELDFGLAVPLLYRRVAAAQTPDVVLDDINKLPFFSPLWARAPVLAIVPHLMGSTVFREVNTLLAAVVWAAERPVPIVYRRCDFEVISESTREDLTVRGIAAERIHVVTCGIDRTRYRADPAVAKTAHPSLVYVGRIKRYKAVDHAIRAMVAVRRRIPDCTLTIVGDGDGLPELRRLSRDLGLVDAVVFAGFVSQDEKIRMLRSAHAAINPSQKEGWALTNIEANACGTSCIAADSPGLRDSVNDGVTGLLYPWGDVGALAERATRVLEDHGLRQRLESGALNWAAQFTWERCGAETLAVIESTLRRYRGAIQDTCSARDAGNR
jgi:glycosyltransferase involved in cell wall biosynthesis